MRRKHEAEEECGERELRPEKEREHNEEYPEAPSEVCRLANRVFVEPSRAIIYVRLEPLVVLVLLKKLFCSTMHLFISSMVDEACLHFFHERY